MNRRLIQCGAMLFGAMAIVGATASESQAFWWGYGCYRPCYRPVACYRPVVTYYAPSCNPCGYSCNPCRSYCNPCGGYACNPCGYSQCGPGGCGIACSSSSCGPGGCGVDLGTTAPRSNADPNVRDPEPPQTFTDPEDDSGFGPRNRDNDPLPPYEGDREALKPDSDAAESTIQQKQPAPMPEPEEAGGATAGDGSEDDSGAEAPSLQLPLPLPLGDTITWKPRTSRTRLQIRASFSNPVVVRTKVDPNKDWVPVATQDMKLVSK